MGIEFILQKETYIHFKQKKNVINYKIYERVRITSLVHKVKAFIFNVHEHVTPANMCSKNALNDRKYILRISFEFSILV